VLARTDLAVGHRLKRRPEFCAKGAKNLIGSIERDAADQKHFLSHAPSTAPFAALFVMARVS
jgi:hypothetical protein